LNQLTAANVVPTWTVAALSTDPVSGLAAWKSLLRTGSQSLTNNPIAGPGTPLANLDTGKQPGSERTGRFEELGGGDFRYTFLNGLPTAPPFDYLPAETLRVGAWLNGAPVSDRSATTFDFVPAGGTPQARDTVLDANCTTCHVRVVGHGVRHGVRLCLTCHTVQNADPDTVDPAAMAGATPDTNPNPLDLGRLIHRIHRGKNMPTLYIASNNTLPAPTLPASGNLPLPFLASRNTPLLGQRYSITGFRGTELVVGKVVSRTDNDQPGKTVVEGIGFPRDLRDCAVCHDGAPQADQQWQAISRRTCGSCHADVWYGAGNTDQVHFAHLGGPQADDASCAKCHLAPGGPAPFKLYVDTRDAHLPLYKRPGVTLPQLDIVQVQNLLPGKAPTVIFKASDANGPISPLNSNALAAGNPVPRGFSRLSITISGPTTDYLTRNFALTNVLPATEAVSLTSLPDGNGQYSYTFGNVLPADASGTWAVGIEARRSLATVHYDALTDSFPAPYTAESLGDSANQRIQYVDTTTGSLWTGNALPRRQVVTLDKCNQCHGWLTGHGSRHDPEYCVFCHAPDRTDWSRRPKLNGNVNLSAVVNANVYGTYDVMEERSIQFKVMVHRIHTGEAKGVVGLDAARGHVLYSGSLGARGANFLDDVRFPNALGNCRLCHVEGSYLLEGVPDTASATIANETATILHAASALHPASDARVLPLTSACMSCHDTGPGRFHAAAHTIGGVETCSTCHGGSTGTLSVPGSHGLSP
jgi:OmcA/MtrC family decaheme c-type cytochrome